MLLCFPCILPQVAQGLAWWELTEKLYVGRSHRGDVTASGNCRRDLGCRGSSPPPFSLECAFCLPSLLPEASPRIQPCDSDVVLTHSET